jgi:hypothetical protein
MSDEERIAVLHDISAVLRKAQLLYQRLGDEAGSDRMRDEGCRVLREIGLIATGRKAS